MTHLVDLVVDGSFLLDIGIRRSDIGFRLVVIVVADEVLDGIVRKEAPEFLVQLCGEGLVVAENERRAIEARDHFGHGEGLARPRDSKQAAYGGRLIVARSEIRDELELAGPRQGLAVPDAGMFNLGRLGHGRTL